MPWLDRKSFLAQSAAAIVALGDNRNPADPGIDARSTNDDDAVDQGSGSSHRTFLEKELQRDAAYRNLQGQADSVFNVKTFGAKGDGVTDDTSAIESTIRAAGVAGGCVIFPAGVFRTSATITVPPGVSLIGSNWFNSAVTGGGSRGFIFACLGHPFVESLRLVATGSSGALDLSGTGRSQISYLWIEAPGGVGLNIERAFRVNLSNLYIIRCNVGVRLKDNTTFSFSKGEISNCTTNAILAEGSSCDGVFRDISVESNRGSTTCNLTSASSGAIAFQRCAFEDNGYGIDSPKVISVAHIKCDIDQCRFSGIANAEPSGVLTDIYFADAQGLSLRDNIFIHNSPSHRYTRHFIGGMSGGGTVIVRSGNVFSSADAAVESLAACFGFDRVYSSRQAVQNDVLIGRGNSQVTLNASLALSSDSIDHSTVGNGETDLAHTTLFPALLQSRTNGSLRIVAAGTKSGGASTKKITFHMGSFALDVIPASSNANAWRVELMIANTAHNEQRISYLAWDGPTATHGFVTAAVDTTLDTVLKITGTCANPHDAITQAIWSVESVS